MNMFLSLDASDCGRRRLIREVAVLLVVSLIAVDSKVPLGRVLMGGRGGISLAGGMVPNRMSVEGHNVP